MIECFIGLGGNIEDPLEAIRGAIIQLSQVEGVAQLKSSRLYATSPVSPIPQEEFLNAAASFTTTLSARELFTRLEEIESSFGKKKKGKQMPRRIDIDLLFYGDKTLQGPDLTLPHPRYHERLFVLIPLQDLTDRLPNGQKITDILAHFADSSQKISLLPTKLPFNLGSL